ncbi:MAG: hypothetical protein M5U22_20590 [Thermoleophilia bacterium]|nr:hypothetical protein [Thermoleophilia bacterium]
MQTALKLQQVGEYEERMRALEAAVKGQGANLTPAFDQALEGLDVAEELA